MIQNFLSNYSLGEIKSVTRITIGLIHETYKIETSQGIFILQKQHEIFSEAAVLDINAVSEYLVEQGITAQTVVKTQDGKLFVKDGAVVWRLLTFIPGEVYSTIPDPETAFEAGQMLGKFYRALEGFNYNFKHFQPLHYATKKHLQLFREVVGPFEDPEINNLKKVVEDIEQLWLPENFRQVVTHGDTKITNVIFQNRKAVALIDIDECSNKYGILIELGNTFRSWCGKIEDDPENNFNLEFFKAGLQGCIHGSKNFFFPEELKFIPQAIKVYTLELVSRFLRDYVEDRYFGWDKSRYPSRKAHNLARAQGQVALYHDIVKKESLISQIIKNN